MKDCPPWNANDRANAWLPIDRAIKPIFMTECHKVSLLIFPYDFCSSKIKKKKPFPSPFELSSQSAYPNSAFQNLPILTKTLILAVFKSKFSYRDT